ncbi:MAG TPA: hypothetical protein VFV80_14140 [Geminicoccaceae bacterium]|nr:hypothetical protein [Geminicoccaceae bacterium]
MRPAALARLATGALVVVGMLLAALAAAASGAAPLALHPVEIEGSAAVVAGHALELVGPDAPAAPTVWEGPIRVRDAGRLRCTLDVELIAGLYADDAGRSLLVVSRSGASTYLSLFDLADCNLAAASDALFTERIRVRGARIEVLPGCECGATPAVCRCSAAKVLRVDGDLALREDVAASRALTRARLGVAFEGEARVADPGGPAARILQD